MFKYFQLTLAWDDQMDFPVFNGMLPEQTLNITFSKYFWMSLGFLKNVSTAHSYISATSDGYKTVLAVTQSLQSTLSQSKDHSLQYHHSLFRINYFMLQECWSTTEPHKKALCEKNWACLQWFRKERVHCKSKTSFLGGSRLEWKILTVFISVEWNKLGHLPLSLLFPISPWRTECVCPPPRIHKAIRCSLTPCPELSMEKGLDQRDISETKMEFIVAVAVKLLS